MTFEAEVENAHVLTDMFGRWPSFHDAELLSLSMHRGEGHGVLARLEISWAHGAGRLPGDRDIDGQIIGVVELIDVRSARIQGFN